MFGLGNRMRFKIFLFLTFFSIHAYADGLGTWNIVNAKLTLSDQTSLFIEPQLRSLSFYDEFHYYEIKGGVTHELVKGLSGTLAMGTYNTFQEGGNFRTPAVQEEVRTWEQVNLRQNFGIFRIENRYRAEQRFTSNNYRNRFRYRLNVIAPLNNKTVEPKTFYLTLWDELFFTNRAPYFERNRIFGGFGYEFSKRWAAQVGYIHQFDYKILDETGRDFLQISLLMNFDYRNQVREFTPETTE
jgi:hypothetical protein